MKQISFFLGLLLLMGGCASKETTAITYSVPAECDYYSLQSAQCLDKNSFIDRVEPYEVIFVGDHHNSANAHKVIVELITELSLRDHKIALANEWFSPKDNRLLQQYIDGELDGNITKVLGWKERVGYDFNLSEPIYSAVIANSGKLYGLNMEKTFTKMVSEQNLTAMSEKQRAFYDSLDLNVTPHQQLLSPFFSHCHKTRSGESAQQCSERMYRVQVAWDSMMGQESAKLAARLTEGEKLIVFVGGMHLESGLGVNLRFSRVSKQPFVTILPIPRGAEEQKEIAVDLGSSDLLYLYDN
ncbi:MAG: ChaN family lipoprotein [Helicobacteraceae bacterium]|nr:ChaN family lipoprotein [Helicobacteraceae bacterium]